ncbi:MAG TPA: isoprenylcysteine carboxylmethyltransferase family protein [Gemmatimonadaceae bacterium]|nr:isoprenylcysteine carboxylmethyltransferase family protein [Gemmatimonadaceae bacterium]
MLYWLRHLIAIAALPFTVAVLIPLWIARWHPSFALARTPLAQAGQGSGVICLLIGLLLFFSSLRRFAGEGEGTLAPWDPPRKLVVRGPYRYVRNPMISGVLFVLFGEALILWSRPHLSWALSFLVINAIYIPLLEEPQLRSRFGESYAEYCRNVHRLIPRLRPWNPGSELPSNPSTRT